MEESREEMRDIEEKEDAREYVERKRWLFFGLPFTFTKYTVNERVITINTGLLNTTENDCYLYKVQDVELKTSLAERIFGLGTVACYTGDNTHPQLYLSHIKHAKEVKDYILLILRILKTGISLEAMPPWVSENGFSSFQAVC